MNDNPTPTGSEMIERTRRMKDMVEVVLINFPQTRGDYLWLWITVLRKFYWKLVRITTKPTLKMEFASFEAAFLIPTPESCRRRSQEIIHEEKERIWGLIPVPNGLDIEEFRESEEGKKAFMKLARNSQLLPTERVIRKRIRNERVHNHEFGNGQLDLNDVYKRD